MQYDAATGEQERQAIRDIGAREAAAREQARIDEQIRHDKAMEARPTAGAAPKTDPYADVISGDQYGPLQPNQIQAPPGIPRASFKPYFDQLAKSKAPGAPGKAGGKGPPVYKQQIKDIMDANPGMSRAEATNIYFQNRLNPATGTTSTFTYDPMNPYGPSSIQRTVNRQAPATGPAQPSWMKHVKPGK